MSDPEGLPPSGPTVAVHRSIDRRYTRFRNQENWLTFNRDSAAGPQGHGCEVLENIGESWWGPQASARSSARVVPADVITYVRAGRLLRHDSEGRESVLEAGEFERSSGTEGECVDTNPSRTHFSHVFRVFLRPQYPRLDRPPERRRFTDADRKGSMFVVASRDGDPGLRIAQDARIFSMLLYPGQSVVHGLRTDRAVWLHVVRGAVSVGDVVLGKGDSVGLSSVALGITAREHSEILAVECAQSFATASDRRGN